MRLLLKVPTTSLRFLLIKSKVGSKYYSNNMLNYVTILGLSLQCGGKVFNQDLISGYKPKDTGSI